MKKGYKAFNKGLKCLGFQYKEGEEFKITGNPKLCEKGFHYCENPLDTLDYYDLCESEFTEVEDHGKSETNGNKTVTNHIKIKARIDLKGFIKASIDFLFEKTKGVDDKNIQAASGDSSQLAASGYSSQLAASGDFSQLAASGNSSQLAASGDFSKLAASGDFSQLAASGDSSQLAASGDSSQLAASGYSSQLAASGDFSQLAASGNSSKLEITGENSVGAAIGIRNKIKGKIGCWITLAEYDDDNIPICVKSAKIDGKKLKPDTWYILEDKKFKETI
jgi:hypothetical protein